MYKQFFRTHPLATGVISLSRARDGQYAAVGGDGLVQLGSPDFQEMSVLPIGVRSGFAPEPQDSVFCASVTCTCWSPDGIRLGCGLSNGHVLIWNVELQAVDYLWQAHEMSVHALSWAPDAAALATMGYDLELEVWEQDGRRRFTYCYGDVSDLEKPFALAWSPTGRYFAVACMDATVRLITTSNGQEVSRCKCEDMPRDLIWVGQQIRMLFENQTLACWNYTEDNTPQTMQLKTSYASPPAAITASAWAADGSSLACIHGGWGSVWGDLRTGVPSWEGEVGVVNALVCGARGSEILLGGPEGIQVLSLTGEASEVSVCLA